MSTMSVSTLQQQILKAMRDGKKLCAQTDGFQIHLGASRAVLGGHVAVATRVNRRTIENMVAKGLIRLQTSRLPDGRSFPEYVPTQHG